MKHRKNATILSFLIGAMAIFIGAKVAFFGQKMPYYVIGWLPLYNLLLGILTIFPTTYLIWRSSRFARLASIITLVSHSLVLIILLAGYIGTVSGFSIGAMFLRIIVWGIILKLLVKKG